MRKQIFALALCACLTLSSAQAYTYPNWASWQPSTSTSTSNPAAAQQILSLVNQERGKAGMSALTLNTSMNSAATVRAGELFQRFAHTRPNGSSCFTALQQAGVRYQGAGENIAYGQTSATAVMRDWMQSTSHRANILNPKWTQLGVGQTTRNGVNYWVQFFTY